MKDLESEMAKMGGRGAPHGQGRGGAGPGGAVEEKIDDGKRAGERDRGDGWQTRASQVMSSPAGDTSGARRGNVGREESSTENLAVRNR